MPEGFLVVDKPIGLTSFGVVARVRRLLGVKKVGHAGTLDPFASGVLVLAVGKNYTRQIDTIQSQQKVYQARFGWGILTDTLDPEGQIQGGSVQPDQPRWEQFSQDRALQQSVLSQLTGPLQQLPPRFSAKKVNGTRMYQLARAGHEFEIQPVSIFVESWRVLQIGPRHLDVEIRCSKGTYIRSLARDLGHLLGGFMYTQVLVRTAVGGYSLNQSVTLHSLSASDLVSNP